MVEKGTSKYYHHVQVYVNRNYGNSNTNKL